MTAATVQVLSKTPHSLLGEDLIVAFARLNTFGDSGQGGGTNLGFGDNLNVGFALQKHLGGMDSSA